MLAPLVDGTVDAVRAQVRGPRFGVAGLGNHGPGVPTWLIAAELVRLRADFAFLPPSFIGDTAGLPLGPAVAAIQAELDRLAVRSPEAIAANRAELRARPTPVRATPA